MRIIGPSELGHNKELRALTKTLNLRRVSIEGPIYGDGKLAAMQMADVFVLPSLNENFAITVAKAVAIGTPVVVTQGSPWRHLETEGCGWWIEQEIEPLAAVLRASMLISRAALKAMGAKGQVWIVREFSWKRVARDMVGFTVAAPSLASAADTRAFRLNTLAAHEPNWTNSRLLARHGILAVATSRELQSPARRCGVTLPAFLIQSEVEFGGWLCPIGLSRCDPLRGAVTGAQRIPERRQGDMFNLLHIF
jgi:hypothetical protein